MCNAYVAVIVLGLSVVACATVTKGTTQIVAVNTVGTQGATCTLSSSAVGTMTVVTPATVTLGKGGVLRAAENA